MHKDEGAARRLKRCLGKFEFYLVRRQETLKESENGKEPPSDDTSQQYQTELEQGVSVKCFSNGTEWISS